MKVPNPYWQQWFDALHQSGLNHLAANVLETMGPLTILGAQVIYVCQPLLGRGGLNDGLAHLAQVLEDPEQANALAFFLRQAQTVIPLMILRK